MTMYEYPCTKGTGIPLGFHDFVLSPGGTRAVCKLCGELGPSRGLEPTIKFPMKYAEGGVVDGENQERFGRVQ